MNNKGEDFTIKGENKHIAARVLQDLTALSTSRPDQYQKCNLFV
jgi:phosphate starvation-inducible PhoH-like protein